MIFKHKKQFGQNFLTDNTAIIKMCEASGAQEEDVIVEIGPGKGVLTEALLERGAKVIAIEKDNDLIPILKEKFHRQIENNKLEILHKDIRDVKDIELPEEYKLVANIPYYITGEIIRRFLTAENQPKSITLLVQDEVAKRICEEEKSSILQLSVKAYGEPMYIRKVKSGSFNPPPKVDSAIIHISNISKNHFENVSEEKFFKILHLAFNQKRKTILKSLGKEFNKEDLLKIFEKIKISPMERPENIDLEKWLDITKSI